MKRPSGIWSKPVIVSMACLIAFCLGVVAVLLYPIPLSDPDTTIEVAYARYGCVEWCPQFSILNARRNGDALTKGRTRESENIVPFRLIGWDIVVFFKGSDDTLSHYLNDRHETQIYHDGHCIEPGFRLKGQFKRRLIYSLIYSGDHYDGIYFDAESAVALGDDSPGCGEAKETPLK